MKKVKNRQCVRHLSYRILVMKRKKNLSAVLAIMLTSILFSALFTIGSELVASFQASTMRQVGGCRMSGVKYILPEDYEKLKNDPAVKNPSYRIIVGDAVNQALKKLSTEVNYAQDGNAEGMFCLPTTGHMPEETYEIAASSLVLSALGVPLRLGEKVPLEIDIDGKIVKQEFTLCGYWEGDRVSMAQQCFVSRKYCDMMIPVPEVPFYKQKGTKYAGYWMMDFDFSNSFRIEGKTKELLKRNGYRLKHMDYGVNWAYVTSGVEPEEAASFSAVLLLILISGYLIIYNIFSLSVAEDIRNYGLYKTIGMTGRQLRRLVRSQALFLSAAGIPSGLIIGIVGGNLCFPFVIENYSVSAASRRISPVFLLCAALFSFLTVLLSVSRPARLAAKVSPVEALKYTETSSGSFRKKKTKKTKRVSMRSVGWSNLLRNRKKAALTVCSLSLGLVLFNSVYVAVRSFSLDSYTSQLMYGDAVLSDASFTNMQVLKRNFEGITEKVQKDLDGMEGIESRHNVYYSDVSSLVSDDAAEEKLSAFENRCADQFSKDDRSWFRQIMEGDRLECELYGLDEWGLEQMEECAGEFDREKFSSGNYAVAGTWGTIWGLEGKDGIFYQPGEKATIQFPDGKTKTYEIMAAGNIPYALSSRGFTMVGASFFIPEAEFKEHVGTSAMLTVLFTEDGKRDTVSERLQSYTETEKTDLSCMLKKTYEEDFMKYIRMFWVIGGLLSLCIGVIGMINFINAMVMGIISRKREFAIMEAVGMTGRQLKQTLIWEGNYYMLLTAFVSVIFAVISQKLLFKTFLSEIWFLQYHFSLLPVLASLPLLLVFSWLLAEAAWRRMGKESTIERLREME